MKKIFLGISLIAFVLFAFNAEATTIKQDKQKNNNKHKYNLHITPQYNFNCLTINIMI